MTKIKTRLLTLVCAVLFTLCVCGSVFATPAQWRSFPLQTTSGYSSYTYGIQAILYRYNDNTRYYCNGIDGIFGTGTKQAVIVFQSRVNITADGEVGPTTWGKLYESLTSSNVDGNYQNFRVTGGIDSRNAIASRYETDGNNIATHWYAHGASTSYIYFGTYA